MKPGEVLLTADQIAQRVAELSALIRRDYADRPLTILAILHGSVVLLADLLKHLGSAVNVELIEASSYRGGTASSGQVILSRYGQLDLAGRDVLILDDIVDTGHTLAAVWKTVEAMGPRSVRTCVLLDKPSRRQVAAAIDYCGFEVPDVFVVGYGLDHDGRYRDLPHIVRLEGEET